MQTEHDRLGALAEAVAKAEPDFDEPARRVALATYRRLAESTAARPDEIAERASESVDLTEHLLALWPGVFRTGTGRQLSARARPASRPVGLARVSSRIRVT